MKPLVNALRKGLLGLALGLLSCLVLLALALATPSLIVVKLLVPLGDAIASRLKSHARPQA